MNYFQNTVQRAKELLSKRPKPSNEVVKNQDQTKARQSYKLQLQRPFPVGLDQDALLQAIDMARDPLNPFRGPLYTFYLECEKNVKLFGQIRTAINKVIKEPWAVVDEKTGKMDVELTRILQKQWWEELCRYVLQAEFYGHSLIEFGIMQEPKPEEKPFADFVFKDVTLIPRVHVRPETGDLLVYPGQTSGIPFREPPFNTWFLEAGEKKDLGLLMYICRYVIYKKYELSDWSRSSEKWSDPLLVIQSSSDDDNENAKKEEFAANFGNNGFALTQKDDEIKLLQRTGSGNSHLIYKDFLEYLDDEMAQGVNGQTGTADAKSFVGAAEVHERLLDDYTEERLRSLMYFHNEKTFPFLIGKGYKLEGKQWKPLKFMKALQDPNDMPDPNNPQDQNNPNNQGNNGGVQKKKSLSLRLGQEYHNCQCPDCQDQFELAYESPTNMDVLIQMAIKRLYDRKVKAGRVDAGLVRANAESFNKAILEGETKNPEKMTFGSSEHRLFIHMRHNVNVTAAFKNYHNTLEMASNLFDDQGKIRPFYSFVKAVKPIAEVYNKDYLQAEYQTAVASARMGSKWQGLVSKGGMLQYKTQMDGRVRDEHRVLEGVTQPSKAPFWDVYYPPNGWRCRCFVRAVSGDGPIIDPTTLPDIKPMFRNNVGKTGKVFTDAHPYFEVNAKDKNRSSKTWGLKMPISPERFDTNVNLFNRLYNDSHFSLEFVDNLSGGYLFRHLNSDKKELSILLKIGKKLALNQSESVIINPIIKASKYKNPDFTLSGIPAEMKSITTPTASAIDNAIREAKNQAGIIILDLPDSFGITTIEKALYNRVQRSPGIAEVRIVYKGEIYLFKREEIINRTFYGKIR